MNIDDLTQEIRLKVQDFLNMGIDIGDLQIDFPKGMIKFDSFYLNFEVETNTYQNVMVETSDRADIKIYVKNFHKYEVRPSPIFISPENSHS